MSTVTTARQQGSTACFQALVSISKRSGGRDVIRIFSRDCGFCTTQFFELETAIGRQGGKDEDGEGADKGNLSG